ncbi:unnamed protein product [Caenorhabditis bovis]|uniref:ZP domain-containing protein n=1 Tax=Caenorhabditis bovis TaxID=2654633 RepID=A0A8S1EK45_9PELO|nr:unnamed protein product [Caenorhabditis bovis]
MAENEGILDVRVELNTLDILEGANPSTPIASALSGSDEIQQRVSSGICLSPFGFASFLGNRNRCRHFLVGFSILHEILPFVSTTVVISFHPQFVTKVDRAYRIQCFYMESDKTVSTQIEVSDLTTAFQTQVVPMPVCKYEILDGGPSGQPIQFATIGQQVYHKWTCDSESTDTFCAVVHSCTVDDGNGDTVQILNEEGCALDKFLLNNLEYPTDLMAGQEAHVYKHADKSQLFYQCQISITIKDPGSECLLQPLPLKEQTLLS